MLSQIVLDVQLSHFKSCTGSEMIERFQTNDKVTHSNFVGNEDYRKHSFFPMPNLMVSSTSIILISEFITAS